ncbi:MAG: CDP-glycerol glycerophosphotransferase family protein [Candidatus Cloacimonetes bacterium]|nr:CDP-glycerol glycerophosphotransferase family protein [Candidatus Cloacimonadota bacterium]
MVGSELFYRPVYNSLWRLHSAMGKLLPLAYFAPEEIDLQGFATVAKHLPPLSYISGCPPVIQRLRDQGQRPHTLLSFPKVLIMSRHSLHKFPCSKIISIGMRHGPYHFKRMTRAINYNRFDLYLFSSEADKKAAEEIGVKVGCAVGFPRLDPAFDGSITEGDLQDTRQRLALVPGKPTLLFSATWDASGMSAIDKWINALPFLAERWNIMVTLHPWMAAKYVKSIQATPSVVFLKQRDLLRAMMLADVCIGDQSSILAECCALGKGMVTFQTPPAAKALPHIEELLQGISLRIKSIGELEPACKRLLENPQLLATERAEANRLMFDKLDGQAGKRAAQSILKLLKDKGIRC